MNILCSLLLAICMAVSVSSCASNKKQEVSPEVLDFYLTHASLYYKHPKDLMKSIAIVESGLNPDIMYCRRLGRAGEKGIMQIRPEFHPEVNPCIPKEAIYYAAKWIQELKNEFGSYTYALVAYNWGPTNLRERGIDEAPKSTWNYVRKVLSNSGVSKL